MKARLKATPEPTDEPAETPGPWYSVAAVADEAGLSTRQVTRMFENERGVRDCGLGRNRYLKISHSAKLRKFAEMDCERRDKVIISSSSTRARRKRC